MEAPERIYIPSILSANAVAIKQDNAIEYIRKDVVDDMLKKAEEEISAEVNYWNQRGLSLRLEDKCLEDLGFEEGDKVKVIIIKDE